MQIVDQDKLVAVLRTLFDRVDTCRELSAALGANVGSIAVDEIERIIGPTLPILAGRMPQWAAQRLAAGGASTETK